MALTHDLCEALAGDITPFCSEELVMSKHDKEKQSMKQIQDIIGDSLGKEFYELTGEISNFTLNAEALKQLVRDASETVKAGKKLKVHKDNHYILEDIYNGSFNFS